MANIRIKIASAFNLIVLVKVMQVMQQAPQPPESHPPLFKCWTDPVEYTLPVWQETLRFTDQICLKQII